MARAFEAGAWVEVLAPTTAEVLAEYRDEALAGKPAVTMNTHGKGTVYYLGAYLPDPLLHEFLAELLPEFPVKGIPEGVEITQRKGPDKRLVFVINNTRERQALTLPGKYRDLISGEKVGPELKLSRNGVLILKV